MTRWAWMVACVAMATACTGGAVAQRDALTDPSLSGRAETVPRERFLAYARSLAYDTSFQASDIRQLTWREGDSLRIGPVAMIAPVRNANRLTHAQLVRGRVLARVISGGPVPRLGLPPGESYLWADSGAGGFRWLVIPANPTERVRRLPLRWEEHRMDGPAPLGVARFIIGLARGVVQVPCKPYGCCCIDPTDGGDCWPSIPWSGAFDPRDLDARLQPRVNPVRVDTLP